MTTSQTPRRTGVGSPVRRALGRSLHALRNLHDEQVYAWECYFRSCRVPRPRTQAERRERPPSARL